MSAQSQLNVVSSKTSSKKIPLQKGYSLMDWIRLTKSKTDLRGTGPRFLKVSYEELQKHNKLDDAWMSIRGRVYNVTKYMKFHPGGKDELLRGAGKDATTLFNDIHPWVNFESMLQACLIGELVQAKAKTFSHSLQVPISVNSFKSSLSSETNKSNVADSSHLSKVVCADSHSIQTSWSQTNDDINLLCHSNSCLLDEENIICDIHKDGLGLTVDIIFNDQLARLNENFSDKVESFLKVKNVGNGSIQIELKKSQKNIIWKNIDSIGNNDCAFVDRKNMDLCYRACKLLSKKVISHDTTIYQFCLPSNCHMIVPVGYHVYFQINVDGVLVTRPYTVIFSDITKQNSEQDLKENLYFLIKTYEDGLVSTYIRNMDIGTDMLISSYAGSFKLKSLEHFQHVLFVCAGTGITPMIRIMHHCLFSSNRFVKLLFFNKTESDILLKQDLLVLEHKFSGRLTVNHVLSQPSSEWVGQTGRVTISCIKEILTSPESTFTCICGPNMFTDLCLKFLRDLNISSSNLYAFTE